MEASTCECVTKKRLFCYNSKNENIGRSIVNNNINSQNIINLKLKIMKWSIWLSVVGIIFLVIVGVFKFSGKSQEQKMADNLKDSQKQEETSYVVNGNENEVLALSEQNLVDEEMIFSEENSEAVSEKTSFNETLEDFNKIDYENIIQ